jgi:amidase
MDAYLHHIDKLNPTVNAIVSLRPRDELIAEADLKDSLLSNGICQGWMHGFPHAIKDLADVAGLPTSYGLVRPGSGLPDPTSDALFVSRIRDAGAIFIGKTNVPELGLGSQTYNNVFGTTYNAYDQTKTSGGSSGGAAVAVALRMLPVADGSDFMGSLRNPPGWNNVFGHRPSFGRVPRGGGELGIDQGGVIGPIARTALDLALLLRTMSGYDPASPLSITDSPEILTDMTDHNMRGRKVAWLGDLGGYLPLEDDVRTVATRALDHFERLGMTVTSLDGLPRTADWNGNEDLWPTWLTYRHWLAGMSVMSVRDLAMPQTLKPEAVYEYDGLVGTVDGGPISAVQAYQNSAKRGALYEAFRVLFETYDYVVLPTAQVMPFDATTHWPSEVAGVRMSSYHRWMEVTTIGTLINAPTLAMPAGFNASGLPVGLQVIGRNHDDASLMNLAYAWEQQTKFVSDNLPPLLNARAA